MAIWSFKCWGGGEGDMSLKSRRLVTLKKITENIDSYFEKKCTKYQNQQERVSFIGASWTTFKKSGK